MELSHTDHPNDLNTTPVSHGRVLGTAPAVGTVGTGSIPKMGGLEEPLIARVQLMCQSTVTFFQ